MARFNSTLPTSATINMAGGKAYSMKAEHEFVQLLFTSFLQDKFYESASDQYKRLMELMDRVSPVFAAKAAVYARNVLGMRSITHVVAGEIAFRVKGEQWTKNFFEQIVRRPDDMFEILSYYQAAHGKTEPNAMKKGFARAIESLDEYQLGKYKGEGKTINMFDVINLVHPRPTAATKKLMTGTLEAPATWEVKITQAGSDPEAKAAAWTELVQNGMPYFALLRNLRNIAQNVDPETLDIALDQLQNEKAIKKSLVMPFRFVTAYHTIASAGLSGDVTRKIQQAISNAATASLSNIPVFSGKTCVFVDGSGSMGGYWSRATGTGKTPIEIATLFAGALAKTNNADVIVFDGSAKYVNYDLDQSLFGLAKTIQQGTNGGVTSFESAFITAKEKYDTIIILSDMQAWVGDAQRGYKNYKARTGADPALFMFDLTGYGTLQFPEKNVFSIAGFSDKVFDLMENLKNGERKMAETIERSVSL